MLEAPGRDDEHNGARRGIVTLMETTRLTDPVATARQILQDLRAQANPDNVAGMQRYGINPEGTLGVSIPVLRTIAKDLRPVARSDPDFVHAVAAELWGSGVHEARILAAFVDVPALVTPKQADAWVAELDSWDVCDQLQGLFVPTPFAYEKAAKWAGEEAEFVKRAGFVLMCALAVHDKKAPDAKIVAFLPLAIAEATDERTYVKKAVNWALRQIGKRSPACNTAAIDAAEDILIRYPDSRTARWVARDALRELHSDAVRTRLGLE